MKKSSDQLPFCLRKTTGEFATAELSFNQFQALSMKC